jgi:hypothetical protein
MKRLSITSEQTEQIISLTDNDLYDHEMTAKEIKLSWFPFLQLRACFLRQSAAFSVTYNKYFSDNTYERAAILKRASTEWNRHNPVTNMSHLKLQLITRNLEISS